MEPSVAKRPRIEHRNAEEIIEEQKLVIENLTARIQQLEEKVKFLESSSTETKIMTIPIPELPNETWLQIMSYLSTYDVLKNVAQVSKRFHKLSQDPHVIRKIEVNPAQSWPKDMEEKYCDDFLGVLKRSLKLRSLSFGFSWHIDDDKSGEMFLEALPSMNHQFLHEFSLKGDGKLSLWEAYKFLNPVHENILKYLEKSPDLEVVKFEFKPETPENEYPLLFEMVEGIRSLKLTNLKEFHLIGVDLCHNNIEMMCKIVFKDFLQMISEKFPKLQRLCLEFQNVPIWLNNICRKFARKKNIKLEISSVLNCFY